MPKELKIDRTNAIPIKPKPAKKKARQRQIDSRIEHIRRDDKIPNVFITLVDHDEAIEFYFNNVIKPKIERSNELINVPILYGNPERWKQIRKDAIYRDPETNQIMTPLIMYKRTDVSKDTNMPVDKTDRHIVQSYKMGWNPKNRYDAFTALNNVHSPSSAYLNVVVPDYQVITYEAMIWTDYTSQMNSIVQSIMFNDGKYWGNPNKSLFYAKVDSFSDNSDMSVGEPRIVKTSFNIALNGYVLPEDSNLQINTHKFFAKNIFTFTEKLGDSVTEPVLTPSGSN